MGGRPADGKVAGGLRRVASGAGSAQDGGVGVQPMTKCAAYLAGFQLLMSAVPASAAEGPVEAPVAVADGKWNVDFGDERCLAGRSFKVGGKSFLFLIEPDAVGTGVDLMFRVPGQSKPIWGPTPGQMWADGKQVAPILFSIPLEGNALLVRAGLDDEEGSLARNGSAITIRSKFLTVTVPLTGIDKVRPIMTECSTSLLESWGFSRADQASVATQPRIASVPRLFTSDDYPMSAIRDEHQGLTMVRYLVDETGRVKDCKIRKSSSSVILDQTTCFIIQKRGLYEPARDRDGKPMAFPQIARIRWVLPD